MKKTETMWAICGEFYVGRKELYVGTFITRRGMIAIHTRDLGHSWSECRANGDRAVKVQITYEVPR